MLRYTEAMSKLSRRALFKVTALPVVTAIVLHAEQGAEASAIPESWWADAFPQYPHPGRPTVINSPFGQCWRSDHKRIVTFQLAPYADFIEGRLAPQYLSRLADATWNSANPPEVF